MGCASIWGSIRVKKCMMKKSKLQKHARCPMHLEAVACLTKCDKCKASFDSSMAPSTDEFQAVWQARCSGGPSQSAIEKVCGTSSKKRKMMEFCLAEALRMGVREHLRRCISLVTHIDGREHRLTACFTGVDGDSELTVQAPVVA